MTSTSTRPDLSVMLRVIEGDLGKLRTRRAALVGAREQAKAAFANLKNYDLSSKEYRDAQEAVAAVDAVDDQVRDVQALQTGILRLLGGDNPTVKACNPTSTDTKAAGSWFAAVRLKSSTTADGIGATIDIGQPLSDRLVFASAVEACGPTPFDITGTSVKIPVVGAPMTPAPVVAELTPIPTDSDPDISLREVEPPKVARIVEVSQEARTDGRAIVLAAFENELVCSIAQDFDAMAINARPPARRVARACWESPARWPPTPQAR